MQISAISGYLDMRPSTPEYAKYYLKILPMTICNSWLEIHDQMLYNLKGVFKIVLYFEC